MSGIEQQTPTERIEAAEHELHVIAEIMEALSVAAGGGECSIEGSWLSWLADRVKAAATEIEEAEMQRKPRAA